jgi:hypothetical protein
VDTLTQWLAIVVSIATIGGAIGTIFGWFRTPIRWLRSLFKKKELSFVQNNLFCRWSVTKLNEQSEPVTLVTGRWRVTNNSDRDVKIVNVRLSKYAGHQSAQLSMQNPEDERNIFVHGGFPIAPHQTLVVEVFLTFFPPVGRAPQPIISDVIFTDNFGDGHRTSPHKSAKNRRKQEAHPS